MASNNRRYGVLSKNTSVLAAVCASLGYFCIGLVRAWASTGIPSLNGNGGRTTGENFTEIVSKYALPEGPLDPEMQSWIVSGPPIGAIVGASISSLMLNYLGRRSSLLVGGAIFLLSFALIGLASINFSVPMILAGRIISGIGVGVTTPSAAVYIAETSSAELRGRLGSLPAVLLAFGCLLGYVVGAYLPWHFLAYFCCGFPVLLMITMFLMPETPAWLMAHKKEDKSEEAVEWLRGGQVDDVSKELEQMRQKATQSTDTADEGIVKELLNRKCVQPLLLSMGLMFLQNWSGVNVLIFKTVDVFDATGSSIDSYLATMIIGVVQLLATCLSILLIDRAGRRLLLMISGLIMTLSMGSQGLFFFLGDSIPSSLDWLPLASIIISFIGYSLGYAAIPYIIIGELLPARTRHITSSISSTFNLLNLFLLLKYFTTLQQVMGYHGVFWLYTAVNLAGVIFVFFLLPETKGKTLTEIEQLFSR